MSSIINNDSNSNNGGSNKNRNANIGYHRDRRASFSLGSSLSDYLSLNRQPQPPPAAYPGPIVSAAAQANHKRRMSMSGLNASPPNPQSTFSLRRASVSSVSSTASAVSDESAIDDSEPASESPTSPFVRKMSWGARALRIPRAPMTTNTSSPTVARAKGFWNETTAPTSYPCDPLFRQRRQSMPPPPENVVLPPKEPPTDRLQERMLRNDFYMD